MLKCASVIRHTRVGEGKSDVMSGSLRMRAMFTPVDLEGGSVSGVVIVGEGQGVVDVGGDHGGVDGDVQGVHTLSPHHPACGLAPLTPSDPQCTWTHPACHLTRQ